MKKQIAVILCVALLLSALCYGCAKDEKEKNNDKLGEKMFSELFDPERPLSGGKLEKTEEEQRQDVVTRFLEATFLTDPAGAAACVPQELQTWAYYSCMNQNWQGKDVSITLYEFGELDSSQVALYADEYQDELDYSLSADEVWGYGFEYTIVWDDGDSETSSGAYGMLAILIDGIWYAIPADL